MPGEPILECERLCKRFDATVAVDEVSFTLQRGDILGLVGENGAGKSTLIKLLGGEYALDSGRMVYRGRAIRWTNPSHALREGIAIVHQRPLLVESMSAAENIFLGKEDVTRLRLIDELTVGEKARALAARYPIYPGLDLQQPVAVLTAGEKQVVEILKGLSYDPEVLILDEPTASLPKEEADRLLALVRRLNEERHLTVVYISHKLGETLALCNRVMVLRNGGNVGVVKREGADRPTLIRMMMNSDLSEFYPPKASSEAGTPLLEVEELRSPTLHGVSLHVNAGEIVGLYGLMGAGMSEVARAVFGIAPITSGRIRLGKTGEVFERTHVDSMVARGVYLVPEDRHRFGLISTFSVRENTSLAHLDRCLPGALLDFARERRLVEAELAKVRVKYADTEQSIAELSGGNQQKVIVSRWLMQECSVFIVDDPTVGIDIGAKHDLYVLLRELTRQGKAVLMISSEITEIIGMADRLYTMRRGAITAELEGEAIHQQNVLENIL